VGNGNATHAMDIPISNWKARWAGRPMRCAWAHYDKDGEQWTLAADSERARGIIPSMRMEAYPAQSTIFTLY
jgi:hypothetical protein